MSASTIVIHEEPTGGFWGEVPALPGCYSQGTTVDELLANLCEAVAGVLDLSTLPSVADRSEGRSGTRAR